MKFFFAFIAALLLVYGLEGLRLKRHINISKELIKSTEPFEVIRENPTRKILVIGDSTAYGTGAANPKDSIAGRISQDFPRATIINRGENGLKTNALIQKISEIEAGTYNLIMIHIGGNDIVQFTNMSSLEKDIEAVLRTAKEKASAITLTTAGNVGTAPILPSGTGWIISQRTKAVRELFMQKAKAHGVTYIDLWTTRENDPFKENIDRYYAPDYFHPSGDGYGIWYKTIGPIINNILTSS